LLTITMSEDDWSVIKDILRHVEETPGSSCASGGPPPSYPEDYPYSVTPVGAVRRLYAACIDIKNFDYVECGGIYLKCIGQWQEGFKDAKIRSK
jgi:hypothetical protein